MEPNMECSICYTTMSVPQYDLSRKEEIELNANEFGLACGHAFHTNCLCRALRMQTSCPLCRNDDQGLPTSTGQIRIGPNNQLELTWNLMDEEDVINDSTISLERAGNVVSVIDKVSAIPERQKYAARVNKAIKHFRKFENEVIRERRRLIGESLESLRRLYSKKYQEKRQVLKKALKHLRLNDEKHISKMENSDQLLHDVNIYRNDLYSADSIVGFNLCRSFWHLNNS